MDYLDSIAKEGILGLLLAASLALNGILLKMLLNQMEKRVESANKVNEQLATPLNNIDKTLALINDKVVVSKGRQ